MYKEDLRTNTVDGARAFEQARHERYDIDEPDYDEQEEDFEDECGCSDTCCPCGGRKRGTP